MLQKLVNLAVSCNGLGPVAPFEPAKSLWSFKAHHCPERFSVIQVLSPFQLSQPVTLKCFSLYRHHWQTRSTKKSDFPQAPNLNHSVGSGTRLVTTVSRKNPESRTLTLVGDSTIIALSSIKNPVYRSSKWNNQRKLNPRNQLTGMRF